MAQSPYLPLSFAFFLSSCHTRLVKIFITFILFYFIKTPASVVNSFFDVKIGKSAKNLQYLHV